jgi:ribosomal protein S10
MLTFNIFVQSKHRISIHKFINTFYEKSQTLLKKVSIIFSKKKSQPFFSILTSPHVNKKAQEQFETKEHKVQLKIKTFEPLKLIIFLKRNNFYLFPNLKFKVEVSTKFKIPNLSTLKISLKKKPLIVWRKDRFVKILDNSGI